MLSIGHDLSIFVAIVGADHRAPATGGDAALLLAVPILWIVGVVVFITLKFRAR